MCRRATCRPRVLKEPGAALRSMAIEVADRRRHHVRRTRRVVRTVRVEHRNPTIQRDLDVEQLADEFGAQCSRSLQTRTSQSPTSAHSPTHPIPPGLSSTWIDRTQAPVLAQTWPSIQASSRTYSEELWGGRGHLESATRGRLGRGLSRRSHAIRIHAVRKSLEVGAHLERHPTSPRSRPFSRTDGAR